MKKFKIVIIWWTSKFGQLWQRYFEEKWQEVIISSRSTKLKPEEAVKIWDIIIFSVSIRFTVEVIKKLIPLIPENKLVMDFTGIKFDATQELKKYTKWEVVATHPMFWPWIKSLENQNIVFDPIKTGEKWDFIYNLWKEDKTNLIKLDSYKHDELVAIVQSTVHFINLLLWHILQKRWIDINQILQLSTPNSRLQLIILSRFLNQNASLYTDMQMYNPVYKSNVIPEIQNFVNYLQDVINNSDAISFENEFNNMKKYVWTDFLTKALDISSKFDEELKKCF